MDLISVIVPVYNVEKYLDDCIESIVNQTYSNLEIILVDDGSPDNCPRMCDEWAKKDSRIKVIHKQNGGQGEARNVAVEFANGDYIGYVDSDDIIAPDMYEKLLGLIKGNNAEAVQCAMQMFFENNSINVDNSKVEVKILNPVQAVELSIKDKITSTCPSTLLVKEIAKKVLFDTGVINEDVMWMYRICKFSNKTVLTTEKLYFYRQRQGSTMNSKYSEKRFDALNAELNKATAVKMDFPELYNVAIGNYLGNCFYHYQMLCRLEKCYEYDKYKKEIFDRFCKGDFKSAFKAAGLKSKIWYLLFRMMPNLTCFIRNSLKIGL